ncbi:HlyD family secretion protein [Neptunicella sp. SCSIO 80796]|uniref:HlyD family secretion protein n=1 Tax=Neptunicella plasticusilytica TaxID=3117012 RepID=UPI003A4DC91D
MNRIGQALKILVLLMLGLINIACEPDKRPNHYTGYVETDFVYIAAPQPGWIQVLSVKEGDEIIQGQSLFQLDNESQQDNVEQLNARLEQARAQEQDLRTGARQQEIDALQTQQQEAIAALILAEEEQIRIVALFKQGLVPAAQRDKAVADFKMAQARKQTIDANIQVAKLAARPAQQSAANANTVAAQAALEQADWQLQQRSIVSRIEGRVDELIHHKGEYVNAGAPVLAMLTSQSTKIRFFVPQADLMNFKVGDKISIIADGQSAPISARISFIADQVEFTPPVIYTAESRQKLVFMLEARPEHAVNLPAGLPVEVQLK